jgi:C-terminal processing protease CtpA/Prc
VKKKAIITKIVACISLLLVLGSLNGYGQTKISKALLVKDLAILKKNLEKIHPGLYTYSSKTRIDEWFAETQNSLKDSMSYIQFYELVAPLNNIIKNGHSFVKLERFKKTYNIIPIRLYRDKDAFYVLDSFDEKYKNLIGKEIIAIEGLPVVDIFNRLLQYQTRDGENLTFPTEKLLYYFNLDYSLIYGAKDSYEITLVEATQKTSMTVRSISSKDIQFYDTTPEKKPVLFSIKDSVGVLTFKTFEKSRLKKIAYKKLLREIFSSIKAEGVKHLIVDVRNNGGGDAVPNQELISYLYDKEFKLFKNIYTITKKIEDKKYYKQEGVFWFNTLVSWFKLEKIDKNYYRAKTKGSDSYFPKADNYKGKLYILTNGRSFSATGEFASFIKHHREAVFIGEEVGGNQYQNTSGLSYYITLPNSRLRVFIPTILWELNVDIKNDAHGVKPDYFVRNSITDELEHKDTVMDFAFRLIKKKAD